MKIRISSGQRISLRRTLVFASVAFAGLLMVIAAALVRDFMRTPDKLVSSPPANSAAGANGPRGFWYVRSGQWRADARSVVAAIRYVLGNEGQPIQSQPEERLPGIEIAMPTNSVSPVPKA